MEQDNTNRELDLTDIIALMWGWFVKYICKPIGFCFRFALRKWWIGVIAVILGLASSYGYYKILPTYKAYVLYENNVTSSSAFMSEVTILSKTSAIEKSELLQIPIEEAAKILEFCPHALCFTDSLHNSYYIDFDDAAPYNTPKHSTRFCIEIKARDTIAYRHIEQGLITYFSNNNLFQVMNNERMARLNSEMNVSTREYAQLDSIRRRLTYAQGLSSDRDGNIKLSSDLNPSNIIDQSINLSNMYVQASNLATYYSPVVTLASNLKIEEFPRNYILKTYKKFVIAFIVLCYAVALCIVYRKRVIEYIRKE